MMATFSSTFSLKICRLATCGFHAGWKPIHRPGSREIVKPSSDRFGSKTKPQIKKSKWLFVLIEYCSAVIFVGFSADLKIDFFVRISDFWVSGPYIDASVCQLSIGFQVDGDRVMVIGNIFLFCGRNGSAVHLVAPESTNTEDRFAKATILAPALGSLIFR